MSKLTEEAITELCKCHGIENEGYSLEEAKDLCGVAEIIRAKGMPVKEVMCNDWHDGDCRCKNGWLPSDGPFCFSYNALRQECEYGGLIIETVGGVG